MSRKNYGSQPLILNTEKTLLSVFFEDDTLKIEKQIPFVQTFADVEPGTELLYINSVATIGVAIRMGDFAALNHVGAGPEWKIEIRKVEG